VEKHRKLLRQRTHNSRYDLLNEVWVQTSIIPALNASRVDSFYIELTEAIRTVDPNHIIFLEPANVNTLNASFDGKIVWAPHFYPLSFASKYYPRNLTVLEADKPAPVNVYGVSKLAGEQLTLTAQPRALIVRVASLFGVAGARGKGGNFIETILKKARDGGPLQVVSDQFMTPTYTMDAADAILRLVKLNAGGVVHASNSGACSWYEFASKAVELTRLKVPVQPVSASTYPSKARRPANSALNNSHLAELLGRAQRSWDDGLQAYLSEKGHLRAA